MNIISQEEYLSVRLINTESNFYLPHEMAYFDRQFDWLVKQQTAHGEGLGEAMAESSETFHDNAPAEAIISDQEVLVNEAKKLRIIVNKAVLVEYPKPEQDYLTLGSICMLSWDGDEPELCYIAGEPNGYRNLDLGFDILPVSANSAIGSSVIQRSVGEVVDVQLPQGGHSAIKIIDLDQQGWPITPTIANAAHKSSH